MEELSSSSSVIEVILDVKYEYEVTLGTRRSRSPRPGPAPRVQFGSQEERKRPVATVHPAIFERKRDPSEESETCKGDLEISEWLITPAENSEGPDCQLLDSTENEEKTDLTRGESIEGSSETTDFVVKKDEDRESQPEVTVEGSDTDTSLDNAIFISRRYRSYRIRPLAFVDKPQDLPDPCWKHRDFIRSFQTLPRQKMECVDGHGCAAAEPQQTETQQSEPQENHKEIPITECLEEFLAGLHLGHLADYLRVLGCTCVRDLRLLETSELEAIQLVSRRRLLQQLDSLKLHHEAPPEDCSLEGWLTWYGLTHISGFLKAIGVHTMGDLTYLRDEDLMLLKPVTRRRILACNRWNKKSAKDRFGAMANDYLM